MHTVAQYYKKYVALATPNPAALPRGSQVDHFVRRRWNFGADARRARNLARALLRRKVSAKLPKCNAADVLKLHLLYLEEVQFNWSLTPKHRHKHLHLSTLLVNLPNLPFELFEWPIVNHHDVIE